MPTDTKLIVHSTRTNADCRSDTAAGVGTATRAELALAQAPGPEDREDRAEAAPLSVLVISPDRRFRSVTTVLIARRGCAVATTGHAGRLRELSSRVGADVVVIDLDEGSPAGAAAVDEARSLARPVGVVLVDEDAVVAGRGAPAEIHCKWGPFEALFAAIEAAGRRPAEGVGREVA